ncbi:glycosyltransferase family 8 protein [Salinarimonas soli]|uniref:Glycosyltransferase family 8 protein n=1 Tax=Salinarimonas soli TaxID=1638099 RepID=A0A5B2V1E1_9HYPH|nr:glycosyltransferase family 8 protein [Salinarimonas soli]KAA2232462.1 glycosyltransferase family 8 protein [Salinarimonas soli]
MRHPDQLSGGRKEHPIVIVTAGDAGYALPMTVALHSALTALDQTRAVKVFVIGHEIDPGHQARATAALRGAHPHVEVGWLRADQSSFSGLPTSHWHSPAMYLRLLIPSLLPAEFERVLYIDGDVVVSRDLSPLWSLGMNGHPVMAVENFSDPTLDAAIPGLVSALGLDGAAPYFNSGVMLIDVPLWRELSIVERTLEVLGRHPDKISFGDQDALNAAIAGDWGALDPSYNVQLHTVADFGHRRWSPRERRRQQRALLSAPTILHYTGPRKPWQVRYRGRKAGGFLAAAARSGWFGGLGQAWGFGLGAGQMAFRAAAAMAATLPVGT